MHLSLQNTMVKLAGSIAVFLLFFSNLQITSAKHHKKSFVKKKQKKQKEPWNKTPLLMKYIKKIKYPKKGMDVKCLARIKAAGVRYVMLSGVKGVKTPIKLLTNKLGGVVYRRAWNNKKAPWILDCKMVENLVIIGHKLRRIGIASIYWTSAWRYSYVHGKHKLSKHSNGLALDVTALDGSFGYAALVNHWRNCGACGRGCSSPKNKVLHKYVCLIRSTRIFKTIYTPRYNARHKDHFHIDSPSYKYKLKVKVNLNKFKLEESKNYPKSTPTIFNGRSHWLKNPPPRKWEPPRSRPHHY